MVGALGPVPGSLVVVLDPLLAVLGAVAEVTGKEELGVVSVLLFAGPELVSNGPLTVPAATCGRK